MMGAYTTYDLSESLERVGIAAAAIRHVEAAWGAAEEDCCVAEWSGGFLLAMRDGGYAYLAGWCDTSGWGCQDDAEVVYYGATDCPELSALPELAGQTPPPDAEWDRDPADLNCWLALGAPEDYP